MRRVRNLKARWQSGYAAACKAVYLGSIPGLASIPFRLLLIERQLSHGWADPALRRVDQLSCPGDKLIVAVVAKPAW
jgi:hypothetical protein